jgi:hypothetical protein
MTIKLHDLRPAPGSKTKRTRVGRGEGSKGKTAGRGTKGTKARKNVPSTFEGGQMPIHMRLPKLKGFRNRFSTSWWPRGRFARTRSSRFSVTGSWPSRSTSPLTSSAAARGRRSPRRVAQPPSCKARYFCGRAPSTSRNSAWRTASSRGSLHR